MEGLSIVAREVAGVLVGDSGVVLAGWVGRPRGFAREGAVSDFGIFLVILNGDFTKLSVIQ